MRRDDLAGRSARAARESPAPSPPAGTAARLRRLDDRPLDQNGVLEHEADQFLLAPFGIGEAELGVGRPLCRSSSRAEIPILRSSSASLARVGGFFKYSTTTGSAPLWRIIASVLRDVPQAGCDRL